MTHVAKRIVAMLMTGLMLLSLAGTALAAPTPDNGLVPLRAVAEAAGATVEWNPDTWTATVTRASVRLEVTIGHTTARLNGTEVPVGTAVSLENSKTMIPLPFLKAVLGIEATWDAATGKAQVDTRATGAMDFMKGLLQGKVDSAALSPVFRQMLSAPVAGAVAAQMAQVGALGQMGVLSRSTNAVHDNVQLLVMIGQTPFDTTIRFDPNGLIDDFYMNAYAGPVTVADAPAYADPTKFTEEEVVVGAGTPFSLPGTLTMPTGQGPFPAIVLVHGSGPNDRDESVGGVKMFRDLAQGLATQGIAVLRYEKRTREHSQKVMLAGGPGLDAETITDALLAGKVLRDDKRIDAGRIFVLGHSQGGYAVPKILARDEEKLFAGALIAAGPSSFVDTLLEQNQIMVDAGLVPPQQIPFIKGQLAMLTDPAFNPAKPPQGFVLGYPQYFFDMRDSVGPLAQKQGQPLFIFQGARDMQVPASQLDTWQKELAGREGVTSKLYPKLNHVFTEGEGPLGFPAEYQTPANVPEYVVEDITEWIQDH
jgi:uncharacterized protein